MSAQWHWLQAMASEEVEDTLAALPAALLEKARVVPVTYQPRPNPEQVEDGIEPDVLGLFVGSEYALEGVTLSPIPAQIILFLENLWEFSEGDEEICREEVHTTYLHELGHYLGLDEEDLFERGLD